MDFAFDSYTSVAYHDVQFDDRVYQDIDELEQGDGSEIPIEPLMHLYIKTNTPPKQQAYLRKIAWQDGDNDGMEESQVDIGHVQPGEQHFGHIGGRWEE